MSQQAETRRRESHLVTVRGCRQRFVSRKHAKQPPQLGWDGMEWKREADTLAVKTEQKRQRDAIKYSTGDGPSARQSEGVERLLKSGTGRQALVERTAPLPFAALKLYNIHRDHNEPTAGSPRRYLQRQTKDRHKKRRRMPCHDYSFSSRFSSSSSSSDRSTPFHRSATTVLPKSITHREQKHSTGQHSTTQHSTAQQAKDPRKTHPPNTNTCATAAACLSPFETKNTTCHNPTRLHSTTSLLSLSSLSHSRSQGPKPAAPLAHTGRTLPTSCGGVRP